MAKLFTQNLIFTSIKLKKKAGKSLGESGTSANFETLLQNLIYDIYIFLTLNFETIRPKC